MGNKRQRRRQRRYTEDIGIPPCPMCGKRERHYVQPSLGEPGFYTCQVRAAEDSEDDNANT